MSEEVKGLEPETIKLSTGYLKGADLALDVPGHFRVYGALPALTKEPRGFFLAIEFINRVTISFGDRMPEQIGDLIFVGAVVLPPGPATTHDDINDCVQLLCTDPTTFDLGYVTGSVDGVNLPKANDFLIVPIAEVLKPEYSELAVSTFLCDSDSQKKAMTTMMAHLARVCRSNDPSFAHLLITNAGADSEATLADTAQITQAGNDHASAASDGSDSESETEWETTHHSTRADAEKDKRQKRAREDEAKLAVDPRRNPPRTGPGSGMANFVSGQPAPPKTKTSPVPKPTQTGKSVQRGRVKKPTAAEIKAAAAAEAKAAAAAKAAEAALASEKNRTAKAKKTSSHSDETTIGQREEAATPFVGPSANGMLRGRAEDRETLSFFDGVANFVFNYAERYHGHQQRSPNYLIPHQSAQSIVSPQVNTNNPSVPSGMAETPVPEGKVGGGPNNTLQLAWNLLADDNSWKDKTLKPQVINEELGLTGPDDLNLLDDEHFALLDANLKAIPAKKFLTYFN